MGKKGNNVVRWKSALCRYGYDAAEGDPENGIALGSVVEDLPHDWFCPQWGTGEAMFREVEE